MMTSTCPSQESLYQYSIGMLDEEQRDALDEHLEGCPDCQATIVTLDDADDTVAGRLRMPLSSESFLLESELSGAMAAAMALPLSKLNARAGKSVEGGSASDMPERLGEYQLLEELGRGGMGRVYKALQTKLDRVVALKVLSRGRVGDRQAIHRFEREMKAVGRLAHANIVQAYDAREIDDTPVLIMEFVDGLDLASNVMKQAQARLDARTAESERVEALVRNHAVSQQEADQAKNQRIEAAAAVQAAKAALEAARLRLEYTRIVAPFSGVISGAVLDEGNLATADKTALATITSIDPLRVEFQMDQVSLAALRRERKGKSDPLLSLPVLCGSASDKGYPYRATMDFVDSHVDPATGMIPCYAKVANKEAASIACGEGLNSSSSMRRISERT